MKLGRTIAHPPPYIVQCQFVQAKCFKCIYRQWRWWWRRPSAPYNISFLHYPRLNFSCSFFRRFFLNFIYFFTLLSGEKAYCPNATNIILLLMLLCNSFCDSFVDGAATTRDIYTHTHTHDSGTIP